MFAMAYVAASWRGRVDIPKIAFQKTSKTARSSAVANMLHLTATPSEPGASHMEPRPDPDPSDRWQLLRLRGKILADEIRRHREELQRAKGNNRARLVYLAQAERAAQRTLGALSRVVYPEASVVSLGLDLSRRPAASK
jgi:hypothetical protein